jgi:hypothetical protein
MIYGKTLPVQQPFDQSPDATALDPSSAQITLWRAQFQRDHGLISDEEMAKVEHAVNKLAKKSITMFNPYTGEIRKVELP